MEQTPNQPLYWDKHRIPVNLTLILALGIAAWGAGGTFGLWDLGGNPTLIFILGVGVAIYTWVTSPRLYLIYADSLYIVYGKPRVKVIHFSNIAAVEMGSLATPDRLRVRPVKGRRQILLTKDPEAFFEQLEAALTAFRAAHPEYGDTFESTAPAAPPAAPIDPPAPPATADPAPGDSPAQPEAEGDYYAGGESDAPARTGPEGPAPSGSGAATGDAGPADDPPQQPEHRPLY